MSSTDYNYDDNGQFFPFFILTLTSLVTLPLTYNVLKRSDDIENTAPRIKSDFKPKDDDLIQAQRRAQKRKEFKTKRTIAVVVGYLIMAWMVYKIIVTKRILPKIWDPYEILGLSRVSMVQEADLRQC
jgi:translocation protein SEC63